MCGQRKITCKVMKTKIIWAKDVDAKCKEM